MQVEVTSGHTWSYWLCHRWGFTFAIYHIIRKYIVIAVMWNITSEAGKEVLEGSLMYAFLLWGKKWTTVAVQVYSPAWLQPKELNISFFQTAGQFGSQDWTCAYNRGWKNTWKVFSDEEFICWAVPRRLWGLDLR